MKTYHVELQRTSYVTVTVEAKDLEEAEFLAWQEIQSGDYNCDDADWNLNSVEEVKI